MSRQHHVHANEVAHVVNDIKSMSREEAERMYGIEIRDDGSVFDPTYNRTFISVGEWADFSVEQDETSYTEDFGYGKYGDDYY